MRDILTSQNKAGELCWLESSRAARASIIGARNLALIPPLLTIRMISGPDTSQKHIVTSPEFVNAEFNDTKSLFSAFTEFSFSQSGFQTYICTLPYNLICG